MKALFGHIARFRRDESGATAIEYSLICGLIFLVIIAAVSTLGASVSGRFNQIASSLN